MTAGVRNIHTEIVEGVYRYGAATFFEAVAEAIKDATLGLGEVEDVGLPLINAALAERRQYIRTRYTLNDD